MLNDTLYKKHKPQKQQKILDDFTTGKIQILCSADILIRGTNVPEAEICLNLRPTLSPAIAEQRAGRVVRIDPHNPRKKPVIVDFFFPQTRSKVPIFFKQVADGMEEISNDISLQKASNRRKSSQINVEFLNNYKGFTTCIERFHLRIGAVLVLK